MRNNLQLLLAVVLLVIGQDAMARKPKSITIDGARRIARITGDPLPDEKWPSPNATARDYDLHGTDLGIMWKMGEGRIGIFFGDSHGEGFLPMHNGGNGGNWRSNLLAFSSDTTLDDGMKIDSMAVDAEGKAREICQGGKGNPDPSKYCTSIPTGAIRAGNLDVVHYMNIHNWGGKHGRWLTNFSSLYYSSDNGATWTRSETVKFDPDSHFSQVAYGKKDGWVYMIGCHSGRGDDGYLARFRENDVLDMSRYEYWNGKKWIRGNESAAVPVIKGPIGEASLMWHKKFKRWIFTYTCDPRLDKNPMTRQQDILYLSTGDITRWDSERKVLSVGRGRGFYGGYLHPLFDDGDTLYYTLSVWQPYNVFLVKASIRLE